MSDNTFGTDPIDPVEGDGGSAAMAIDPVESLADGVFVVDEPVSPPQTITPVGIPSATMFGSDPAQGVGETDQATP